MPLFLHFADRIEEVKFVLCVNDPPPDKALGCVLKVADGKMALKVLGRRLEQVVGLVQALRFGVVVPGHGSGRPLRRGRPCPFRRHPRFFEPFVDGLQEERVIVLAGQRTHEQFAAVWGDRFSSLNTKKSSTTRHRSDFQAAELLVVQRHPRKGGLVQCLIRRPPVPVGVFPHSSLKQATNDVLGQCSGEPTNISQFFYFCLGEQLHQAGKCVSLTFFYGFQFSVNFTSA